MIIIVSLAVLTLGLTACSQRQESPADVVQAAARAFVQGYDGRDLTTFDSYFATPSQGGDAQGLVEIQGAAHKLAAEALPDETFELRSFEIQNQRLNKRQGMATVHYRAEISLVQNEVVAYAATVEQDIALVRSNGRWLISGADQSQVTPSFVQPDQENS